MDITQLLAQENPTMSSALRRRQAMGDLGMLTGDDVLGRLGAQLGDSARSEAWQNTQTEMNRRNVLSRALESEADRKFRMEEEQKQRDWMGKQNDMNRGLERAIAQLRADTTGKKYRQFTAGDVTKLNAQANEITAMDDIVSQFDDNYARMALPGGREAANWLASKGMGTDNAESAQQWWASWDRIYTLPVRNEMFGSALTATEQEAWRKANISPDMNPKQIRENLKIIAGLRRKATERLGGSLKAANYDPEAVDYIFGSGLEDEFSEETGSEKYSVGQEITVRGKTYRVIGGNPDDPDLELVE